MQLTISFTCRQCGRDAAQVLDTSSLALGEMVELRHDAGDCGHVSGELHIEYTFRRADHAPNHEIARTLTAAQESEAEWCANLDDNPGRAIHRTRREVLRQADLGGA